MAVKKKPTKKKVDPPKVDTTVVNEKEPVVIPPQEAKQEKPKKDWSKGLKAEPKVDVVKIFKERYEATKAEYQKVKADKHLDFKQQQVTMARLEGMISVFEMVLGTK